MAANVNPIFCRQPQVDFGQIATANTAKDGTGTVVTVFTADATEGGRVDKLVAVPKGTNVATVLRVFLNNGADPTVATNNVMIAQVTCPATTNSEVAALAAVEIPLDLPMPPGYKLNIAIGTTIAAGLAVSAQGGKY